MSRNDSYWNELFDKPIFTDREHRHYEWAWRSADALRKGGRLTRVDLINLMGLIDAAVDYGEHNPR